MGCSLYIVGDAFVDLLAFLGRGLPEPGGDSPLTDPIVSQAGGSAVNTATQLMFLMKHFSTSAKVSIKPNEGLSLCLYSVLNENDNHGRLLKSHLENNDINFINCRSSESKEATGHCVVLINKGERSFMSHTGCVQSFDANALDIDRICGTKEPAHVHISGYYNLHTFWDGNLLSVLQDIRERRSQEFSDYPYTTFSLVPQHDARDEWGGGITDLIPLLDFLFLNELEATRITGRGIGSVVSSDPLDIDACISYFTSVSKDTCFVVTRGAMGAFAFRNGKIVGEVAKSVTVKMVDSTGAGDAFIAGFLHRLWQTYTPDMKMLEWKDSQILESIQWGCAVGTAVVGIAGASTPPPVTTIQELADAYQGLVN